MAKHIIAGAVVDGEHPLSVEIMGLSNIVSNPPSGCCRITNVYWDPEVEKVVVEHDDEPV